MRSEIVHITNTQRFEVHSKSPLHLLVAYQRGVRSDGETWVEGAPRVNLKDLRCKLTFVPANSEFREWQEPRVLPQMTYLFIEPSFLPAVTSSGLPAPRVMVEDPVVWNTISKMQSLMESAAVSDAAYLEAVGTVLSHELARMLGRQPPPRQQVRGGLATWQKRLLVEYIDCHLSEEIPLATLAELTKLSPHHLCRAFKQCIGCPPGRYQGLRRIDRAKQLLTTSSSSVTEIGLELGFSETSSFSNAFKRISGLTPTDFRRTLS